MPRRQTRTVSLNQVLTHFVNDGVSVGHHSSGSDVVRADLRAFTVRREGRRAACAEAACG